eukprot:322719_1
MWFTLLSTLLIIHRCTAILHFYTYVEQPMTLDDAKLYCASEGSELAVVLDDADVADIIAEIPDNGLDAPWIGLEKESEERGGFEIWSYPDLTNDDCPHSYAEYGCGKCVNFWVDNHPIEDGNDCTVFYKNVPGINNDVDCTEQRPFVCHNFDLGHCSNENWECGDNGQALKECGRSGIGNCFCDKGSDDNTMCVENVYCSWAKKHICTSNASCEDDEICTFNSCCRINHCSPLCGQWDFNRRRLVETESRRLAEEEDDCSTHFDEDPTCEQ